MTRHAFDTLLKDASPTVARNAKAALAASYEDHTDSLPSSPEFEPPVRDDPLATTQGKITHAGRVSVCITSHRARLTDPDNLCGKYFVDLLRYSGLIRDDRQEDIDFKITQTKVPKGSEKTVIEIEEITPP